MLVGGKDNVTRGEEILRKALDVADKYSRSDKQQLIDALNQALQQLAHLKSKSDSAMQNNSRSDTTNFSLLFSLLPVITCIPIGYRRINVFTFLHKLLYIRSFQQSKARYGSTMRSTLRDAFPQIAR